MKIYKVNHLNPLTHISALFILLFGILSTPFRDITINDVWKAIKEAYTIKTFSYPTKFAVKFRIVKQVKEPQS